MVKIRTIHGDFTLEGYQWTGENELVTAYLNSRLAPDGPSGADINAEFLAAQDAIDVLGGEIVYRDGLIYVEGRIY